MQERKFSNPKDWRASHFRAKRNKSGVDMTTPLLFGLPDRIRTCDLESRSLTRYPAVPRVVICLCIISYPIVLFNRNFFILPIFVRQRGIPRGVGKPPRAIIDVSAYEICFCTPRWRGLRYKLVFIGVLWQRTKNCFYPKPSPAEKGDHDSGG